MSLAATAAIQRAVDVRHAAQLASEPAKEANIKVPPVGKRAKVSFQDDCLVDSGNVKNKYLGDLAYDKYPTYKDVVMLSCK